MKVHFNIDSERAVRDAFAKYHEDLGYRKILVTQEAFPDYILEDLSGKEVRAEAEYRSSGYNHPLDGCDVIICWEDDRELPVPRLELCRYIDVPRVFEGFSEGELEDIPKQVQRYVSAANKSKNFLKELSLVIRRRDHSSTCSDIQLMGESYAKDEIPTSLYLYCGRKRWAHQPVIVSIDFMKGLFLVEARLYTYLERFREIGGDTWRRLFDVAENEGFKPVERKDYLSDAQDITIEELMRSLENPKFWLIGFAQRKALASLYQSPDAILDSTTMAVISALSIMEQSGIYGPHNSNKLGDQ